MCCPGFISLFHLTVNSATASITFTVLVDIHSEVEVWVSWIACTWIPMNPLRLASNTFFLLWLWKKRLVRWPKSSVQLPPLLPLNTFPLVLICQSHVKQSYIFEVAQLFTLKLEVKEREYLCFYYYFDLLV